MKETSGELSMTLVTIIAIGVILGIFYAFKDKIGEAINNRWNNWEKNAQTGIIVRDFN